MTMTSDREALDDIATAFTQPELQGLDLLRRISRTVRDTGRDDPMVWRHAEEDEDPADTYREALRIFHKRRAGADMTDEYCQVMASVIDVVFSYMDAAPELAEHARELARRWDAFDELMRAGAELPIPWQRAREVTG